MQSRKKSITSISSNKNEKKQNNAYLIPSLLPPATPHHIVIPGIWMVALLLVSFAEELIQQGLVDIPSHTFANIY